jgi:hypothetical protein
MMAGVAERFEEWCAKPDPHPAMVQEARGGTTKGIPETKTAESGPDRSAVDRPSGSELARRAIDDGKVQGDDQRVALGAQQVAKGPATPIAALLNGASAAAAENPAGDGASLQTGPKGIDATTSLKETEAKTGKITTGTVRSPGAKAADAKPGMQMASAAGLAARPLPEAAPQAPPPAAGQKCRVWTASYGGQKALIIKAVMDKVINYTVLDVNEGAETREAEAFISAYAKNGAVAGEFVSQSQALEKAFELCPEG